jgi:hypothetical protein
MLRQAQHAGDGASECHLEFVEGPRGYAKLRCSRIVWISKHDTTGAIFKARISSCVAKFERSLLARLTPTHKGECEQH